MKSPQLTIPRDKLEDFASLTYAGYMMGEDKTKDAAYFVSEFKILPIKEQNRWLTTVAALLGYSAHWIVTQFVDNKVKF